MTYVTAVNYKSSQRRATLFTYLPLSTLRAATARPRGPRGMTEAYN